MYTPFVMNMLHLSYNSYTAFISRLTEGNYHCAQCTHSVGCISTVFLCNTGWLRYDCQPLFRPRGHNLGLPLHHTGHRGQGRICRSKYRVRRSVSMSGVLLRFAILELPGISRRGLDRPHYLRRSLTYSEPPFVQSASSSASIRKTKHRTTGTV